MRTLIALLCIAVTGTATAQSYLGVHSSNYDPIKSQLFNPALSATSLMKWEVNLFGVDFHAAQDYLKLKGSISDFGDFDRDVNIGENLNGRDKSGNITMDFQGPSFVFNSEKTGAISFYWRTRSITEANDVSEEFLTSMFNDANNIYNWFDEITDPRLSLNTHSFSEMAFGYSRYVFDDGKHALSAGANLKLLVPIFSGKASGNVDITVDTDAGTANFGTTQFSAISGDILDLIDDDDFKYKFKIGGFGADIGVVYELKTGQGQTKLVRKDKQKVVIQPDYFVKAGISFNDIGSIKYNHSKYSRVFTADGSTHSLNEITQSDSTFIDFDEVLEIMGDYTEFTGSYKTKLPTYMSVFADVKLTRGIYVNASAQINMGTFSENKPKAKMQNIYSITPRFELPAVGIQMPMAYNPLNGFEWGASIRAGGFVIGSSNIFSYLWNKEATAIDIQFAVAFGQVNKDRKREQQFLLDQENIQPDNKQLVAPEEPGKIEKSKGKKEK